MEKSQAYIIATAIVVAGLIVAAAVLTTKAPPNNTGRYVPWTTATGWSTMLDTQSTSQWRYGWLRSWLTNHQSPEDADDPQMADAER